MNLYINTYHIIQLCYLSFKWCKLGLDWLVEAHRHALMEKWVSRFYMLVSSKLIVSVTMLTLDVPLPVLLCQLVIHYYYSFLLMPNRMWGGRKHPDSYLLDLRCNWMARYDFEHKCSEARDLKWHLMQSFVILYILMSCLKKLYCQSEESRKPTASVCLSQLPFRPHFLRYSLLYNILSFPQSRKRKIFTAS